MAWSLLEHIVDYLKKPDWGEKKLPTLWPSSGSATTEAPWGEQIIKGKCRRNNFFTYLQYAHRLDVAGDDWDDLVQEIKEKKERPNAYSQWIFKQGDLYEDFIVEMAKQQGIYEANDIPVFKPGLDISGKIDLIIFCPEDEKWSVVECKSVYSFGADAVIGKKRDLANGHNGNAAPRDSNLIQIAFYDWHFAKPKDNFGYSRLLYGARGNGRYGEYLVDTFKEDGIIKIRWKPIAPVELPWKVSDITLTSVFENYRYVLDHVYEKREVPPRDHVLRYSLEDLINRAEYGELNKSETKRIKKIQRRLSYNQWVRSLSDLTDEEILNSWEKHQSELPKSVTKAKTDKTRLKAIRARKPKRELKMVRKGDFQCNYCSYSKLCYKNPYGEPTEL